MIHVTIFHFDSFCDSDDHVSDRVCCASSASASACRVQSIDNEKESKPFHNSSKNLTDNSHNCSQFSTPDPHRSKSVPSLGSDSSGYNSDELLSVVNDSDASPNANICDTPYCDRVAENSQLFGLPSLAEIDSPRADRVQDLLLDLEYEMLLYRLQVIRKKYV